MARAFLRWQDLGRPALGEDGGLGIENETLDIFAACSRAVAAVEAERAEAAAAEFRMDAARRAAEGSF